MGFPRLGFKDEGLRKFDRMIVVNCIICSDYVVANLLDFGRGFV